MSSKSNLAMLSVLLIVSTIVLDTLASHVFNKNPNFVRHYFDIATKYMYLNSFAIWIIYFLPFRLELFQKLSLVSVALALWMFSLNLIFLATGNTQFIVNAVIPIGGALNIFVWIFIGIGAFRGKKEQVE